MISDVNKCYLAIIFIIVCGPSAHTQNKYDYNWILGYNYNTAKEDGYDDAGEGMILNFEQSPPTITKHPIPFEMLSFNVISHPETGQLQYYTNGCRIINADHEVMDNGDDINAAGQYHKFYCQQGINSWHSDFMGSLSLPMPGEANKNQYVLFTRPKYLEEPFFDKIWYSRIDMNANEGKGKVVEKNIEIFRSDRRISTISLQACKHQNGKDWWVLQWERTHNRCFVILLDENGPSLHHIQEIGSKGPFAAGQSAFSPDGTKYVWYDLATGVFVYDFDRSTGMLSNPKSKVINEYYIYARGGVSFSPNSRFVYLSARSELYQLDLWEDQFDDAFELIDTIYTITPFGILLDFSNSLLAPDCKVYISTSFTWQSLHVIHHPNEKGKACGLEKLSVTLPWPNSNGAIPNNPHYRMDEKDICDSTLSTFFPEEWYRAKPTIYPNPAMDMMTIQTVEPLTVRIYSIDGTQKLHLDISSTQTIDISALESAIYIIQTTNNSGKTNNHKLIKI